MLRVLSEEPTTYPDTSRKVSWPGLSRGVLVLQVLVLLFVCFFGCLGNFSSLLVSQLLSPDEQAALSHNWELCAVSHKDLEPAVVLRHCSHAHLGEEDNCIKSY